MSNETIKFKILDYLRRNDYASYVEMERIFEECCFDYKGDLVICSIKCENVVFWVNWNKEAIDLINEMKEAGLIQQEVAHPLIYLLDGKGLNLPRVKRNINYKTEHWLPLVFRLTKAGVEKSKQLN